MKALLKRFILCHLNDRASLRFTYIVFIKKQNKTKHFSSSENTKPVGFTVHLKIFKYQKRCLFQDLLFNSENISQKRGWKQAGSCLILLIIFVYIYNLLFIYLSIFFSEKKKVSYVFIYVVFH